MRGAHVLKHWSTTQPSIALSGGEAELVSVVRGACEGIGIRSLLEDLDCSANVELHADASAAMGMAQRTGVGRVRHLDTRLLWIQDKVKDGEITIYKIDGSINPSDILTKYLTSDVMISHLIRMGCTMLDGRAALAPNVCGKEWSTTRGYFEGKEEC